ncbi:MAG: hypothetical protein RR614_08905 [Eubacterium sp.]
MGALQEKDREVFQVLLVHWINHNSEHVADYHEWAEKMASKNPEVAKQINEAIDAMQRSAQKLMEAKIKFQED